MLDSKGRLGVVSVGLEWLDTNLVSRDSPRGLEECWTTREGWARFLLVQSGLTQILFIEIS